MLLPQTGPGRSLLAFLHQPDDTNQRAIAAWLENLDGNLKGFLRDVKPPSPDRSTRYHSPEILQSEPFLKLLLTLPPAQELGLSLAQLDEICAHVDIWRALAGTLGLVITQAMSHAPKRRKGLKRPGGPDLWQTAYLGVVEVFVASDRRLLEAASEVASALRYPRCVVRTADFLSSLGSADAQGLPVCRVCGCLIQTKHGVHAELVRR